MRLNRFQKLALGVAGVVALAIGAFITLAPHGFYAGYGITIGSDPSQLSELRAPGANLTAMGLVMLAGLFRQAFARVSVATAFIVFLAFPAGRIVSLVFDGMPSAGILVALGIELAIAALCLVAFAGSRTERADLRHV